MQINEEIIKHTANLARLKLTDSEVNTFTKQIGDIVTLADKLNEVDTSGVDATAYILPIENVFREDVVKQSYNRDEMISNAPTKEAGYITVSKVME